MVILDLQIAGCRRHPELKAILDSQRLADLWILRIVHVTLLDGIEPELITLTFPRSANLCVIIKAAVRVLLELAAVAITQDVALELGINAQYG